MARPDETVPEAATNRDPERSAEGEEALRAAIAEHGDQYAAAVDHTDELEDLLTTTAIVIASAEDEDVEYVRDSMVSLVQAADGLSTEGAATLADGVGENGEELAAAMDAVVRLQRDGHLDTFVTLAEAFSESLSPDDAQVLATAIEDNGDEFAGALETVLELEREDDLEDLVDTAKTLSGVSVDEDAVAGMNRFLASVGEAELESEPIGPLGLLRSMWDADVRAGLGYLVTLLRGTGRRVRGEQ